MNWPRWNQRTARSAALITTLPLLAILCRGYAPKSYDTVNVPFWEREAPLPVQVTALIPARPLPAVLGPDSPRVRDLMGADEDRLLASVEEPGGLRNSPQPDGAVGDWLTAAARMSISGQELDAKQDRVALRLMSAQSPNGFFGTHAGKSPISAPEYTEQTQDLSGLIAYFAKTRSPIVVLPMLRSGDYLMSLRLSGPGAIPLAVRSEIAEPLTNLYLQTGDRKYLTCAKSLAATDYANVEALCDLYRATGNVHWLAKASQLWHQEDAISSPVPPAECAALYRVTMNPNFLKGTFSAGRASELPPDIEFAATRAGVSVIPFASATENVGPLQLSVSAGGAETRIAICGVTAGSRQITLRVLSLRTTTANRLIQVSVVNGSGKPLQKPACSSGPTITLRRFWHSGDIITLARPNAPDNTGRTV